MQLAFSGKKIIVGVTGGIAAYKSCFLVRELKRLGAEVRVLMTPAAIEFVAPLTFSTLSENDVIVNIFAGSQKDGSALKTWHIEYALWADLIVIAPATMNTVAKIVNGFADNALTTVALARRSPMVVAPAADVDMYTNEVSRQNMKKLASLWDVFMVEAEKGFLASGLEGIGRMADIDKILLSCQLVLEGYGKDLTGKSILITAGPTFEDIDPVRFISNRSSGKMGFEIAKAAWLRGANVTLITGPSYEKAFKEINIIKVRSALEMKNAVTEQLKDKDALIMSAAVADYRPAKISGKKIKKEDGLAVIELTKTDDILASIEKDATKIVGFALETDEEIFNAQKKLKEKNLDLIVLNSLRDLNAGFEFDTNKVTIIDRKGEITDYPLMSKFQTANNILTELKKLL